MTSKYQLQRRDFLKAGAAVAAFHILPSGARANSANGKLRTAHVGVGGMGGADLSSISSHGKVEVAALCDVFQPYLAALRAKLNDRPDTYGDYPRLLERKDIDAVLIATPEFWHARLSVQAACAGKDVFCEKPCSMTIQESRALADAFRRTGRIYQAGTQRRNGANFVWAVEAARTGNSASSKPSTPT